MSVVQEKQAMVRPRAAVEATGAPGPIPPADPVPDQALSEGFAAGEAEGADAAALQETVIRARRGWEAVDLREVWRYRELLLTFAARDLKLRYRQTALGPAWVVLQPLLASGIFAVVFGEVAKLKAPEGLPYFVVSLTGMLGWNVFANTLGKLTGSLVGNAHLVSKVYFPRLILPLSTVASTLVDFAVSLGVLAVVMAVLRIEPHAGLLLLPVFVLMALMIAVGAGLWTAALTVKFRDVAAMVGVALQMLFFASPAPYAIDSVPAKILPFYQVNPLTGLLEGIRWSVLGTGAPSAGMVTYSLLSGVVLLVGGVLAFSRMERRFADII